MNGMAKAKFDTTFSFGANKKAKAKKPRTQTASQRQQYAQLHDFHSAWIDDLVGQWEGQAVE